MSVQPLFDINIKKSLNGSMGVWINSSISKNKILLILNDEQYASTKLLNLIN